MEFLKLGIVVLIVGLVLSILPAFGLFAGPLMYIGWVLIAIGLILAVLHVLGGTGRRHGRGRTL